MVAPCEDVRLAVLELMRLSAIGFTDAEEIKRTRSTGFRIGLNGVR